MIGEEKPTVFPLNVDDYKRKVKLALEKYYMGSYISEHPLDPFPYADIDSAQENEVIKTTGIVTSVTCKNTKRGSEYLTIKFKTKDDIERTINVFDTKIITDLKQNLKKNQIIIVKGRVSKKYNNINALSVKPVAFTKQSIDTENLQIDDKTNESEDELISNAINQEIKNNQKVLDQIKQSNKNTKLSDQQLLDMYNTMTGNGFVIF